MWVPDCISTQENSENKVDHLNQWFREYFEYSINTFFPFKDVFSQFMFITFMAINVLKTNENWVLIECTKFPVKVKGKVHLFQVKLYIQNNITFLKLWFKKSEVARLTAKANSTKSKQSAASDQPLYFLTILCVYFVRS